MADMKRRNAWERVVELDDDDYSPQDLHYLQNLVYKRPKFTQVEKNRYLDISTKRAALMTAPFVVALVSYTGDKELNQGSGTIIASDESNIGIVLTSANLVRRPSDEDVAENAIADDLKIVVKLFDGRSCEGEIYAYDFHYNIAAIKFESISSVSGATMRRIDDSLNMNPRQCFDSQFVLRPHRDSSPTKLVPGDTVVAVGRYFSEPYDIMAAPGEFRLDCCGYDCKEVFKSSVQMTRCGDGGPLVNCSGEIIGIAFYDRRFTPFLPINVAYKWWELCKKGELRRPSLGMEAANFYTADLDIADKIIQRFPTVSEGVIVEKVISGSSADSAGLRLNDVIIECAGKAVRSFLEFLEILWDNVGNHVELVVARADRTTPLLLKMMVAEPPSDKLNSWPYRVD